MNLVSAWGRHITLQRWSFLDTISLGTSARYVRLLNSIFPSPYQYPVPQDLAHVAPLYSHGLHFVFNNQKNASLGHDGYDNYQAPSSNGEPLFRRRMWVKGSLAFKGLPQVDNLASSLISCNERVLTPRCIASSVFVPIKRTLSLGDRVFVEESRVLVYTNDKWLPLKDVATTLELLAVSADIIIDRNHLLQYSMLTSNMHKIHFDQHYCREEGFSDVIVHGPLMVSLLLHWCQISIGKKVITFNYKNSLPCFVNTLVKLACEQLLPTSFKVHATSSCLQKTYLSGIISTE